MDRRQLLAFIAATPLSGLARAQGTTAPAPMSVAANQTTIESGPLLISHAAGVHVIPLHTGREASAQLVAGKVDAATGNETQASLASIQQPQLRIVLTLAECRYRIVARRSAGIGRIADLRGKRIAFTPNTSSEYFLATMLATADLKLADITPVKLEPEQMPPALQDQRADAMAMWEPQPQIALNALGKDGIVFTNDGPGAYFERFNLNTTTAVLNDPARRATLVSAFKAISDMAHELSANPRKHWPALSKAVDTPVHVIEQVWPQFRFPARLDTGSLMQVLEAMEPWAAQVAKRQPRTQAQLMGIMDPSVASDAGL
jgi:NitT/TauT family transport system substrate-binding protein